MQFLQFEAIFCTDIYYRVINSLTTDQRTKKGKHFRNINVSYKSKVLSKLPVHRSLQSVI